MLQQRRLLQQLHVPRHPRQGLQRRLLQRSLQWLQQRLLQLEPLQQCQLPKHCLLQSQWLQHSLVKLLQQFQRVQYSLLVVGSLVKLLQQRQSVQHILLVVAFRMAMRWPDQPQWTG